MPPIGPSHNAVVDRLNRLLVIAVGERAIVRVQGSTAGAVSRGSS